MIKFPAKHFEKIFDESPIGKAIVGINGNWIKVNQSLCEMLGYDEAELLKMSFQEITHPDDLEVDFKKMKALSSGKISHYLVEKRYIAKSGSFIPAFLGVSLIKDDQEKPLHFISQVIDLSSLKKKETELNQLAEELKVRNDDLANLAHITSHDLQEPIRTMVSFTNLLMEKKSDQFDEVTLKSIQFIDDAAKHLKDQVKGIMDYYLLEKEDASRNWIECQSVVERALQSIHALIDESKAEISIQNLPKIHADENQMNILFQNLIGNAIKFTKEGSKPHIVIKSEEQATQWRFEVIDNGRGISDDDQTLIFQLFKKAAKSEYRRGSGIGLAHCEKIVKNHGGKIGVSSILNKGSKFYFTIKKPK